MRDGIVQQMKYKTKFINKKIKMKDVGLQMSSVREGMFRNEV